MVTSVTNMLDGWVKSIASGNTEIEVCKHFWSLTADVIARTAYGTSYVEGKRIFELQAEQTILVEEALNSVIYVPGSRFLPTRKNIYRWKLQKEIERSLKELIESREQAVSTGKLDSYGNDLLGIVMKANRADQLQGGGKTNLRLSIREMMDDCKTFFFAGSETTSSLLTWTMVLLGMHPTWQDRARKEVIEMCGYDVPANSQILSHLKVMGMILNESLRLYTPLPVLTRQTPKNMKHPRS